MRRTKLIWFALGATTSAIAGLLSWMWNHPLTFDGNRVVYIILTEPIRKFEPNEEVRDEDMMAFSTGQILRDCGARAFETTGVYNDHAATAEFPLIPENDSALECVINAIGDRKIPFKVEMRWSSNVAKEIRANAQTH